MTDSEKIYLEIYKQTERRLEVQLSAAVARDQRALVITGFSVVASGLAVNASDGLTLPTLVAAATVFLFAAIAGAFSAFPREFHGAGYQYSTLVPSLDEIDDYITLIASLAEKNDEYIRKNDSTEVWAINLYRFAVVFFSGGAIVGVFGIFGR